MPGYKRKARYGVRKRKRASSGWKRARVGYGAPYGGSGSAGAARANRDKAAVAPARLGESIQTEAALRKYLFHIPPHIRLGAHPYLPKVQSMVHMSHMSVTMVPANATKITNILFVNMANPHDPLGGSLNTRGTGYDHMAATYKHCMVTRCEVKITFYNYYVELATGVESGELSALMAFQEGVAAGGTLDTEVNDYIEIHHEQKFAKAMLRGGRSQTFNQTIKALPSAKLQGGTTDASLDGRLKPGVVTISKTWNASRWPIDRLGAADLKATGNNMGRYICNTDAGSETEAGPAVTVICNFGAIKRTNFLVAGMDNPIQARVEMYQHVTWWEPDPTASQIKMTSP